MPNVTAQPTEAVELVGMVFEGVSFSVDDGDEAVISKLCTALGKHIHQPAVKDELVDPDDLPATGVQSLTGGAGLETVEAERQNTDETLGSFSSGDWEIKPLGKMRVHVANLLFSQDSIGKHFRDGRTLQTLITDLARKKVYPASLGPFRVVEWPGKGLFTLDQSRPRAAGAVVCAGSRDAEATGAVTPSQVVGKCQEQRLFMSWVFRLQQASLRSATGRHCPHGGQTTGELNSLKESLTIGSMMAGRPYIYIYVCV
jgi:hypothetical protein